MTWLCFASPRVTIEVEACPGTTTVVVRGELDLATMPFLAAQLALAVQDRPRRLVFDLGGTHFMDCGSARLIASAGQWLPGGGRPVIRRPRPGVLRVLEITGLGAHCEIEPLSAGSNRARASCPGKRTTGSGQMSVSMHDVRHALSELGKLRFGEMRVEDAMHHIVQTTHAIFSVDGAGLMLADVDHHLLNAAVSDDRMRHLEELQIRHQEGPCIAAFEDKELVRAEDLTTEERWPTFSRHAIARGVKAVLASPIPYNQDAVGVVAVLSEDRRPWSAEAELALLAFTDLAALLIASMLLGEQQTELAAQLQSALNSRAIIEQAKGVLIGQQGLSAHAAYAQLRARARAERRKLAIVSAEVVRDAVRPESEN
jgi:anti-anti-sigma factor